MPDLGLNQLDDDQLLNLLNEAVGEILSRDPIVHRIAQKGILSLADKQEIFMDALRSEVLMAKAEYMQHVMMEVRAEICKAVSSGEFDVAKAVGIEAETKVIVDVTKDEIGRIKRDMQQDPQKVSFEVRYNGRTQELVCSYHAAGNPWDAKRNLSGRPDLGASVRKAVLGAFGIPMD